MHQSICQIAFYFNIVHLHHLKGNFTYSFVTATVLKLQSCFQTTLLINNLINGPETVTTCLTNVDLFLKIIDGKFDI